MARAKVSALQDLGGHKAKINAEASLTAGETHPVFPWEEQERALWPRERGRAGLPSGAKGMCSSARPGKAEGHIRRLLVAGLGALLTTLASAIPG